MLNELSIAVLIFFFFFSCEKSKTNLLLKLDRNQKYKFQKDSLCDAEEKNPFGCIINFSVNRSFKNCFYRWDVWGWRTLLELRGPSHYAKVLEGILKFGHCVNVRSQAQISLSRVVLWLIPENPLSFQLPVELSVAEVGSLWKRSNCDA